MTSPKKDELWSFVSHNMGAITRLCTRVCWMDGGRVTLDGTPTDVVARYLASSVSAGAAWSADADGSADRAQSETTELSLLAAGVRDASGQHAAAVRFDQPFRVDVSYRVQRPDPERSRSGVIHGPRREPHLREAGTPIPGRTRPLFVRPGTYRSSCFIPKSLLKPGRYWLSIAAHVPNRKGLDRRDHVLAFDVVPVEGSFNSDRLGLLTPVLEWEIQKLS